MSRQKPNHDDRSNNVERLHDMIENTQKKIEKAEVSMEFSAPEDQQMIKQKNERRRQSIEAMKDEMQDEMNARNKREI